MPCIADDGCELNIRRGQNRRIWVQDQCPCWSNSNNTCGQVQPGDDILYLPVDSGS